MGTASVTVVNYNGSLADILGLSAVNDFGPEETGTLTTPDDTLDQSDDGVSTYATGGGTGQQIDYIGSGTLSLIGLNIPLIGTIKLNPVPVSVFSVDGQIKLILPEGFPNLLGLNLSSLLVSFDIDPNATYKLPDYVPCYTAGTLVITPQGERPVEMLRKGDHIIDHEGRPHEIIYARKRVRVLRPNANPEDLRQVPVEIPKDCFGPGAPRRDLLVSQHHRVAIPRDDGLAFVRAKLLLDHGFRLRDDLTKVTYVHFMCRDHATVQVEGMISETLYPGTELRKNMPELGFREEEVPEKALPELGRAALGRSLEVEPLPIKGAKQIAHDRRKAKRRTRQPDVMSRSAFEASLERYHH